MSREAPKGKRKSQGRSRYCEIAESSPEPGWGATKARGPVACGLEITGGVRGGGSPPG